ncbi:hypothetical protein CE91St30_05880 [Raoultibacter timonensis]|uniref:Secreted protein n=1 Tax=Raoultibacter timonensis TaxID=1907662 RepID=A0ABM7WG97_9ACTN|nr:hypothetical protein CE91St30_05880 [Raoultibacter timonensis]BDF49858.1 hypothetical protein CE91St31_05880 [Raoultibacter timonensis]
MHTVSSTGITASMLSATLFTLRAPTRRTSSIAPDMSEATCCHGSNEKGTYISMVPIPPEINVGKT